jgi:hypothetical protein
MRVIGLMLAVLMSILSTSRAQVSNSAAHVALLSKPSRAAASEDTAQITESATANRVNVENVAKCIDSGVMHYAQRDQHDVIRNAAGSLSGALREHYVTIRAGMDAHYLDDHRRAESLFAFVSERAREHPVGPLMRAGAIYAEMKDHEVFDRLDEFRTHLDSAQARVRSWIEAQPDDAWGYCFLGHVHGYRAMWEGRHGSWFKALKLGLKAKGAYHDALRRDSTCWDAYVGLGSYHYWKSAKTEFINWTGLIMKDDKEKGLVEMRCAMERSYFARAAAAAGLIWMHLHRGAYTEALELAIEWHARYPEGKTFLWGRAYAEYMLDRDDSALVRFDSLRARVLADPAQGLFNLIEIDYHRAQLYGRHAETERACALMDSVLAYPADEDVRERQKDHLKEARAFVKQWCRE